MAKEPDKTTDAAKAAEEAPQEAAVQAEAGQEAAPEESVTLTRDEFLQVKAKLDALEAEREEMKQLAQRVQADFDNYRRRNAAIHADSVEEGSRNAIKAMLPALDNFDRALENSVGVEEGWLSGIKLVYKQLLDSLTKLGLEEIPAEGAFDPAIHEAVMQEEAEGKESGQIVKVLQKGYKVKERIIRHSMVTVAK